MTLNGKNISPFELFNRNLCSDFIKAKHTNFIFCAEGKQEYDRLNGGELRSETNDLFVSLLDRTNQSRSYYGSFT